MRSLGPVAQEPASVARVDDLLDREPLGGAERGGHGVQALLDLGAQRYGVVRRLEVAAVGGLDAAGERQRSPLTRRPRVASRVAGAVALAGAGDAVDLPDQDRCPGNARLVNGVESPRAAADRPGPLRGGADHE